MVRFFCDVGIADGGDEVYYTKWRYRVGIIQVLNNLWDDPTFIEATRKIKASEEFSSFIGHIITDLNLCMDEGFQKIPEYKALLQKGGE